MWRTKDNSYDLGTSLLLITYPYGVLKYVLVRVDGPLFLADLVILDMLEDLETPLLLARPFLTTCKAPIDVAHR